MTTAADVIARFGQFLIALAPSLYEMWIAEGMDSKAVIRMLKRGYAEAKRQNDQDLAKKHAAR